MAPLHEHGGWIPVPVCEQILRKPVNMLLAVDGSPEAKSCLEYCTDTLMQHDKASFLECMHIFDDNKTYLAPAFRPDSIRAVCDSKLTGSLPSKRWRLNWKRKFGRPIAKHICDAVQELPADFVCMGYLGRKGAKKTEEMASNVLDVLMHAPCTVMVLKDEDPALMPRLSRPTRFVVCVSMNQSSTKAFLDALKLSKPGDEVHVIYVRSYMEAADSEYTLALRKKYEDFLAALQDENQPVFSQFGDRKVAFEMVPKQLRESTAQAAVRFADDVDADFLCVGSCVGSAEDGSAVLGPGALSLSMCVETSRNFMVSSWVDVQGRLFDDHVRPPSGQYKQHEKDKMMLGAAGRKDDAVTTF